MNKTPRILLTDAYTLGSYNFESDEAKEKSVYYLTFRRHSNAVFNGDQRIVFCGLQRLLDKLLKDPVTHEEIDEVVAFLKLRKFTNKGLRDFDFPEQMWRRIVDEFDGEIPLKITAFPEGSVVYPNEPVMRVSSTVPGMGPLAAWFESSFIKLWATTERATQARHWLEYNRQMIRSIEKDWAEEQINFAASIMMHDFGDRSGAVIEESEELGYVHLYCFPGTDTFCGAYQAWKDGAPAGVGGSVDALAHRIVQGFVREKDCYEKIYNGCQPGDIVSMVADCYDYYEAVKNYLLPLAQRSASENNGITVVARPDSGDALEQVLWTVNLAVQNGLYEERNGYKYMTRLRIIEGDGMTFDKMKEINEALIANKFAVHGTLVYGVGGFLRNNISRDNLSTKYALCSVGLNNRPVIKLSNTPGKETLPYCTVSRDKNDLNSGITLFDIEEDKKDSHILYYNGNEIYKENFVEIQNRILNDFDKTSKKAGILSLKLNDKKEKLRQTYLHK